MAVIAGVGTDYNGSDGPDRQIDISVGDSGNVAPTLTESLRRASPRHGSCRAGCSSASVIPKTWLTPSAGSKASSTTRCPLLRDVVDWKGPGQCVDQPGHLAPRPEPRGSGRPLDHPFQRMELGRRPDSTVTPGDDKMAEVGRLVDYGVDAGLFGRSANLTPGTRWASPLSEQAHSVAVRQLRRVPGLHRHGQSPGRSLPGHPAYPDRLDHGSTHRPLPRPPGRLRQRSAVLSRGGQR
jgi:hypothetical protein